MAPTWDAPVWLDLILPQEGDFRRYSANIVILDVIPKMK